MVFLGGSITEGAMTGPPRGVNRDGEAYDYVGMNNPDRHSWRALVFEQLRSDFEQHEGQFRMVNAAVGATHSELAAYRFRENITATPPDLLLAEFAVNDNAVGLVSDDPDAVQSIYRTMTSVLRQARELNPEVAIIVPVSTHRDLNPAIRDARQAAREHHFRFAHAHRLPTVDIQRAFTHGPFSPGATPNNVFDGPDNPGCAVHPSPHGHATYAIATSNLLGNLLRNPQHAFPEIEVPAVEPYPTDPVFLTPQEVGTGSGWQLIESPEFKHLSGHVSNEVPILYTENTGAELELTFQGTAVMIWGVHHFGAGQLPEGQLHVEIDGEHAATFAASASGSGRLTRLMPVTRTLAPGQHHLALRSEAAEPGGSVRIGLYGIGIDRSAGEE